MDENPFASPLVDSQADFQPRESTSEAEGIRKRYINHEASVQSIGFLYYLGALFVLLALVMSLLLRGPIPSVYSIGTSLLVAIVALQIWVGRGLRGLKRQVKIPVAILSGFVLIGALLNMTGSLLIGAIINGYILYLIFSRKGAMVFSPEYAEIIAQTPHIKYKTSKVAWVVLTTFAVLLVLGMIGFLLAGE